MSSPALGIQGRLNYFGGLATFYPGDIITFTLENGTMITDQWKAYYNSPGSIEGIATGGDFYNFFVLGIYPASSDLQQSGNNQRHKRTPSPANIATSSQPSTTNVCAGLPTATGWSQSVPGGGDAYPPVAVIAQPDLKINGGGFISGYFIDDVSRAVLSIPRFDEYGDATNTFSNTIKCFIESSQHANIKQIVIDVQQNNGGNPLLAFDAFRQVRTLPVQWKPKADITNSFFRQTSHGRSAVCELIRLQTQ